MSDGILWDASDLKFQICPQARPRPQSAQADGPRPHNRAYLFQSRNRFVKQYQEYATFLRNEVCGSNLGDFKIRKGRQNLEQVRQAFTAVTDRFAVCT